MKCEECEGSGERIVNTDGGDPRYDRAIPCPECFMPRVTSAVRAADIHFERVGGGSYHWVRDCFLPMLEQYGLKIVPR